MEKHALGEPMFVGREAELEKLQANLDAAFKGKGSTVFVSGEAGSGKTRLAKEFIRQAENKGAQILSGWCLSSSAIPYFPFVEAFNSYHLSSENENKVDIQLLQIKKQLTGQSNKEDENESHKRQTWKDQTFSSVIKELLLISTQKPLLVFIDDVQWADSASLALLQYLARAINNERIMILATARVEELKNQTEKQIVPLEEILRIMRREDLYEPINLTNLPEEAVGKISESMLGCKVNPQLIERLYAETQGNPLFIVESVKMLAENQALVKDQNLWTAQSSQFGIAAKVKDVILRRVNALDSEKRSVLDAGSVIGENFDGELLGSVLEQTITRVLGTLNAICKTHSLVCAEQDYYRFDHPKTREVLYEELSPPLRKHYHLKAAEILESKTSANVDAPLADLAYHFVQAGNREKSLKYSLLAGKNALAHFGYAEAIKHFNYVLQVTQNNPALASEKTDALEGLGDANYDSARFKEAIAIYKTLSEMGGPTKPRALRKAMDSAFFQNEKTELQALMKEAEKCQTSNHLEQARILMNKARIAQKIPGQNFVEFIEQALRLSQEEESNSDTAYILIGYGASLAWIGQLEKATEALLKAIALCRELNDSRWLMEAYYVAGDLCISHMGLLNEGIEFLKKAITVNEESKINEYMRLAEVNAQWARALGLLGKPQAALTKSLEALRFAEKTESNWAKGMAYANLTTFYSLLDDAKNAKEFFDKLMSMPPGTLGSVYVGSKLASAFYYAGTREWETSAQIFNSLLQAIMAIPTPGVEAMERMCYASVLKKEGKIKQAQQQEKQAQILYEGLAKRLEKANIQINLTAPAEVSTDQAFEIRLDVINISKKERRLDSVKNIVPEEFKVTKISSGVTIENGTTKLDENSLAPFTIRSVKLTIQASKAGQFKLNPKVIYLDDNGESKTADEREAKIRILSAAIPVKIETPSSNAQNEIEFKSEAARKIFDYLLKAFRDDYNQRKMPQERSGWRTLMDIVKQTKVSRYCVYGFPSSQGQAIAELQRSGIVEVRVFEGERGRGGKILKVRVLNEKLYDKR